MAKSDRVHSTPPTSASAILEEGAGAHGADKLSPVSLIPTRSAGACQPVCDECEPDSVEPTSTGGQGRTP